MKNADFGVGIRDLSRQGADVAWLHSEIVPGSGIRNPAVRSVIRLDSEL